MSKGFLQYRGGDGIAGYKEAIVHPTTLASGGDDARAAEIRQMARDFWLADLEDFHEVADANFLVGDEIEEAQASGIGQGAKEGVERERFLFPGHALIIYGLTDMSKRRRVNTYAQAYIFSARKEALCPPKPSRRSKPTSPSM